MGVVSGPSRRAGRYRRDHAAQTLIYTALFDTTAQKSASFQRAFPGDDESRRLAPNREPRPPVFTGDKLAGRYRIVNLIGEGAIGEVYEAFDEALAEPLALKTLRAQVASQAVTVERFRREIRSPAR